MFRVLKEYVMHLNQVVYNFKKPKLKKQIHQLIIIDQEVNLFFQLVYLSSKANQLLDVVKILVKILVNSFFSFK